MLVLLNDAGCPVARRARPWAVLLARVRASRLDRDLARGVSPDASVPLALRAQMLVGARTRREVARGAQRILAAATREPARVPVCRDRVRDSAGELGDLIQRLLAGGPVAARGVALASVLLRDGGGPVYHRASADDVRVRVREAVRALDPAIPGDQPSGSRAWV
jgi:hypothetical protein